MLSKKYAVVDRDICVACGACTKECPKSAISVFRGCYAVVDKEICIGCGKCAGICPAGCIGLAVREEKNHEK
jgi:ferredoxin